MGLGYVLNIIYKQVWSLPRRSPLQSLTVRAGTRVSIYKTFLR